MTTEARKRSNPWPTILVLVLCVLPPLLAASMMVTHWVAVPFWDEWETPGAQLAAWFRGTLRPADLFSQHNEHRLFFPRLVWLPLAIIAGWDTRHEMVLNFCLACGLAWGLWKLLRQSGGTQSSRAGSFVLISLLLFSPRQYETLLIGTQGQTLVPACALVAALLGHLSRQSLPSRTLIAATSAFVATYSFGNGMLLWLLAFPFPLRSENIAQESRPFFWRALYVVAGIAAIAAYFISYRHPSLSPPLVSPLENVTGFGRFVLIWLGSLFPWPRPEIVGGIVLALFLGLTTLALRHAWKTANWRPSYPWIALGSYALLSGAMAAMARLGFAWSMAGDSRYAAFSVTFYVALVGLGFCIWNERRSGLLLAGAVAFAIFVVVSWPITFKAERRFLRAERHLRQRTALAVRWTELIPNNPDFQYTSPYSPAELLATIRTLSAAGALRPRLVSPLLASRVQEPPNLAGATHGTLERVTWEPNTRLRLEGHAAVTPLRSSGMCIVAGYHTANGKWKAFCTLPLARSGSINPRVRFAGTVDDKDLPEGELTFSAWLADIDNQEAFPLAGEQKARRAP